MANTLLTTAAILQCPHGGSVAIVSSNTQVKAVGSPLALATDTFTVSGCPFQIPAAPSPIPSPCVTVQWLLNDLHTKVNSTPTLSTGSSGLCLAATQVPQGNVVIVQTQQQASGS